MLGELTPSPSGRRVVTAMIVAPLVIAIICLPTWVPFVALLALVGVLAWWEAFRLLTRSPGPAIVLATIYVFVPLSCLAALRIMGSVAVGGRFSLSSGAIALLQILFTTWAGDSAAYFLGSAIGRHKIAPNVSPNKSWEGAAANFAFCLLVSWAYGGWAGEPSWLAVSVGAVIGVLGQAGDLLESSIKRRAGVKDSSSILPGHGGVLDRIDSILLAAPFVFLLFRLAS